MFQLDKKLEQDCFFIADLKISKLLLMNDSNFPWLILVPKKADLVEIGDMDFADQIEVLQEINLLTKILKEIFFAEKINIAALGNVVRQLHIHVIARFENDAVFPKPVWGNFTPKPYEAEEARQIISKIQKFL